MKRFLTILSLVLLGFASISCYDDSALWDSVNDLEVRVKTLETLCTEMNANLTSLKSIVDAQKNGDYIVDVAPLTEDGVEVGYKITFNERGTVNIYHGKDALGSGSVPVIGVKPDSDGIYYWTVNGEWILDDKGNKLPVSSSAGASGVTPKLKVENEKWYVSYDEGKTWEEVGSAVAAGTGGCLFKNVELTEGSLTLTLVDGTVISIPVGERFRIVFGDFDAESIQYGVDVEVPYKIEGAKGDVSVFVLSDSWMFETELVEETSLSGKVIISQDDYYDEEVAGKVAIFAVAEDGTIVSKIIRLLTGVLYPSSDNYNDIYTVSAEAGQFEFTVSTNRELTVKTGADWITYADTKAVEEKTLVFDVKENEGAHRKTYVEISSGDVEFGFTVTQKGNKDGFSVDLTYNEVIDPTWFIDANALYNKAGQKIYEVLGYSSWEELGKAAGDYEQAYDRLGEVKFLAYDLYTGDVLPYYEEYRHGLGFYHDSEGYFVNYWDDYKTSWDWLWSEYLSNYFIISVNQSRIYAGETYSFGILLTSPHGEARIEVSIEVTEYIDPEEGLYDNPAAPGRYEFTICDTLDLDYLKLNNLFLLINTDIAETIKSTLGMTTYEIANSYLDKEYHLVNGDIYGDEGLSLDQNGYDSRYYYDDTVVGVSWRFGEVPGNMYMQMSLPTSGWTLDGPIFTSAVSAAAGKTIKYDYVIRYEDYELIFTHKISIVYEAPEISWGLMGMFEGNEWQNDIPMEWDGEWYVAKGVSFTDLSFKVRGNATWDDATNIGFIPDNGKGSVNQCLSVVSAEKSKAFYGGDSADIKLMGEPGIYDVYFSYDRMQVYVMEQGYRPGETPVEDPDEIVRTSIWKNDGSVAAATWSVSPYRFAPETNSTGEEVYAVPTDTWEKMKTTPFKVQIQPAADWFQIRILDGWWTVGNDEANDITPNYDGLVDNGDGTFSFELDLSTYPSPDTPLVDVIDERHLLFAGDGFTILEMYWE